MARYILIVARNQPGLFGYLRQRFARSKEVEVLFDRRRAQRRQRAQSSAAERRQADRRTQRATEKHLREYGFAVFRRG